MLPWEIVSLQGDRTWADCSAWAHHQCLWGCCCWITISMWVWEREGNWGPGCTGNMRGLLAEVDHLHVWEGWHSWKPVGTPVYLTTIRRVLRSAENRLVLLVPDKSLLSPLTAANKSRIRKLTAAYTLWKNTVTTCKIYSLQYCCRWRYKILLRGFWAWDSPWMLAATYLPWYIISLQQGTLKGRAGRPPRPCHCRVPGLDAGLR